jgi:hypothetical protein
VYTISPGVGHRAVRSSIARTGSGKIPLKIWG